MPTDIYTLGIEVDSTDIVKADDNLDDLANSADRAGNEVQDFGNKSKVASSKVKTMSSSARMASGRMGGLGRNAGQAGIQIQQFVGQVQGGQSAMVALSQQGADLGIVLGAPLVGVIVSLGAVLAGTLIPQLFGSKDAASDAAIEFNFLSDSLSELTEQQKTFAALNLSEQLLQSKQRSNDLKTEIDELTNSLSVGSLALQQYIDEGRISEEQAAESAEFYTEQAVALAKLNFQFEEEAKNIELINDRLLILNGQKEETLSRNGKQPWWGGDAAVEAEAAAIRMQMFRDAQAELDAARQENLAGYQSILEMQFQSERVYEQLTEEESAAHLTRMSNLYGEYADSRTESDIEAAKRASKNREQIEEATQKNVLAIDKSFNSIFSNLMDSQSKELFEIGKVGAASKAAFDAYGAINATLAQGGAFAAPAAWAIGAAAFLNVSKILGTKYGGTGGGVGGAPNIPEPQQQVSNENTQNVQNTFNITGGNSESIAGQIQELFDSGSLSFRNGSVVSA